MNKRVREIQEVIAKKAASKLKPNNWQLIPVSGPRVIRHNDGVLPGIRALIDATKFKELK